MKCFYCGQESDWIETKSSNMVDFEGRIIIIKNVPCLKCRCCGEEYFVDDVMEKDEELFEIGKQAMYDYVEMDYEDPTKQVYKLIKVPVQVQEEAVTKVAESANCYSK